MKKIIIPVLSFFLILFLPISGAVISGFDSGVYLSFPPVTGYVKHAPFSWIAFAVITGLIITSVSPPVIHIIRSGIQRGGIRKNFKLPWWGYVCVCTGLVSWLIAWTRLPVLHDLHRLSFLPLWISYFVVINALCIRRSGSPC
jgi:hypothetical protein